MEDRALGFAAAAHAQLAEPASRATATKATIPTASARCPRPSRSSSATPSDVGAPVRDPHRGHVGSRRATTAIRVSTNQGEWRCRTVVLATGACNIPRVPAVAAALPPGIVTLTPMEYRNPDQLPEGGVLVVGASATGTQIAEELQRVGPAGDARRRRAHPRAARLSRPGHQVVDGRRRRDGRPLRRAATTSSALATCRRCSSRARPTAEPSISTG